VLDAYRRELALDRTAARLGIPTRTLCRIVYGDPELERAIAAARRAATE